MYILLKQKLPTPETAADSQPSSIRDEHSLPVMVPRRHHTKTNQLKMTTPSTTPAEPEPISLKQFNCAAADLDAKGEVQLKRYRKYLDMKRSNMEATNEFALCGELIRLHPTSDHWKDCSTAPTLFQEVMMEKV